MRLEPSAISAALSAEQVSAMLREGPEGVIRFNNYRRSRTVLDPLALDLSGVALGEPTPGGWVGPEFTGLELSGSRFDRAVVRKCPFGSSALKGATFREAELSDCAFGGALVNSDFTSATLTKCDLVGVVDGVRFHRAVFENCSLNTQSLRGADFTSARFVRGSFTSSDVEGAVFVDVRGLFGLDRADTHNVSGADYARYWKRWKHWPPSWESIAVVGRLPLFGASYAALIAILVLVLTMRWYNLHAEAWRAWAVAHGGEAGVWAGLIQHVPRMSPPPRFGLQLLAILLLAVGATIYAMRCPDFVRQYTGVQWVREHKQSQLEYLAGSYSRGWARIVCAICYLLGGTYTIGYLIVQSVRCLWFIWQGAGA